MLFFLDNKQNKQYLRAVERIIMSNEEFQSTSDNSSVSRRSFLLTYSQADMTRFPTCQSFADVVMEAFDMVKSSRTVKEWACCKEKHTNGGTHYHLCVNISGSRRWNPVKNHIYNKHSIAVNFATNNCGYVAAYRYVCKDKPIEDVLHSDNHTDLKTIKWSSALHFILQGMLN